jgi:hypothetical protein
MGQIRGLVEVKDKAGYRKCQAGEKRPSERPALARMTGPDHDYDSDDNTKSNGGQQRPPTAAAN